MKAKIALLALALLAAGCIRDRNQREWEYMPDMYRSAAIKAQEAAPQVVSEDTLKRAGAAEAVPTMREAPKSAADTAMGGVSKADTAKGDTSKAGVAAAAVSRPQPTYPRGNSLMRLPPEGTVPRDREVFWPGISDSTASFGMVNPLPVTAEVLETGKKYFNIYCAVCHGFRGAGDGPVIPRMPPPPALFSDKVRQWPDGRIHHVIVHGQGNMPSYRRTVDVTTRWAIIHYLRVIQRAENPTEADLLEYKKVSQQLF